MSYLHSHNIINRDLKPENILIDERFYPKISDFGLSKMIDVMQVSMNMKSINGIRGTPLYMAPEVLIGCDSTKSSDVYAFGFIVYEIINGKNPFNNIKQLMNLTTKILKGERPPFEKDVKDVYRSLIEKCWQHEADQRPSFDEIVEDLRNNKNYLSDPNDIVEFEDYVFLIDNIKDNFDKSKRIVHFKDFYKMFRQNQSDYYSIGEEDDDEVSKSYDETTETDADEKCKFESNKVDTSTDNVLKIQREHKNSVINRKNSKILKNDDEIQANIIDEKESQQVYERKHKNSVINRREHKNSVIFRNSDEQPMKIIEDDDSPTINRRKHKNSVIFRDTDEQPMKIIEDDYTPAIKREHKNSVINRKNSNILKNDDEIQANNIDEKENQQLYERKHKNSVINRREHKNSVIFRNSNEQPMKVIENDDTSTVNRRKHKNSVINQKAKINESTDTNTNDNKKDTQTVHERKHKKSIINRRNHNNSIIKKDEIPIKIIENEDANNELDNINISIHMNSYEFNDLSKECQKIVEESKNDPNKQFYVGQSLIEGKNDFPQNIQLGFQYIFKLNKEKNIDSIIYYVKILLKDKNKY